MSVLDELAAYLESQGVGVVGTTIFKGRLPDSPDDAIVLYEYSGVEPQFTHDDTTPYMESPQVQVVARSTTYPNGRSKIDDVYTALSRVYNMTISGTLYYRVRPSQNPFYLRRDDKERVEFAVNMQVHKAVSP